MSNSNGFQEMKKQAKEIIDERIKKSKPILKEMLPPPTPFPLNTQLSSDPDERPFHQMLQEELDKETHEVVVSMFGFARTFARTINGRKDEKQLEKYIEESIPELEYLLKK